MTNFFIYTHSNEYTLTQIAQGHWAGSISEEELEEETEEEDNEEGEAAQTTAPTNGEKKVPEEVVANAGNPVKSVVPLNDTNSDVPHVQGPPLNGGLAYVHEGQDMRVSGFV
jgi:hypothetical protein